MNKFKLTLIAGVIAGVSGLAQADNGNGRGTSNVIDGPMSRISADAASGDGVSTVRNECGGGVEGWDAAAASIEISQRGSGSHAEIEITNGAPNTLYTVWVRMSGKTHNIAFGGSPITGGGATPLAHSDNLDQLVADWIGAGSPAAANGFNTDENGNGEFEVNLDFPVVGGAYPFNRMSHQAHLDAEAKRGVALTPSPTAIVNPADVLMSGSGFLIRVISHCQDGLAHGLSPAKREAWFQYP
ncbi:MAG: hypothetical protein RQ982_05040 [Gammaproteobacteria bacterium]|nr:hypothetical protein [Gammaproteobacteria bacterium]